MTGPRRAAFIGLCVLSGLASRAVASPFEDAIRRDAPLVYDALTDGTLPPRTEPGAPPAGRRMWNTSRVVSTSRTGDRLTVSLSIRAAHGRWLAVPAAAPWLEGHVSDGVVRIDIGPDVLTGSLGSGWSTVSVIADGPAGHISLLVDGLPVDTLERAPFTIPVSDAIAVGPMVGDVSALALWADVLTPDRPLDHALIIDGLRPAAVDDPIAIRIERGAGRLTYGCPRFAPDGRWLAACRSSLLVLVDRLTGSIARTLYGHLGPIADVAMDPAGRFVATAGADGRAILWSVDDGRRVAAIRSPRPLGGVAFSPDGRWLATWSGRDPRAPEAPVDAVVELWPLDDYAAAPTRFPMPGPVSRALFAPTGPPRLAIALRGRAPRLLTPDGPPRIIDTPPATALAWGPDALVVGDAAGGVYAVGDGPTVTLLAATSPGAALSAGRLPALSADAMWPGWPYTGGRAWFPPEGVHSITALAADHARVVAATDGGLRIIRPGASPTALPQPASTTAVLITGGTIYAGASDGAVRRFALDGRPGPVSLSADGKPVRHLAPGPQGQIIAVSSLGDWFTRLVSTSDGADPRPRPATPGQSMAIAVDADGRKLIARQASGELSAWSLDALRRLDGFSTASPTTALAWTDDGPVTGHADGALIWWNPLTGTPRSRRVVHAPGSVFEVGGTRQASGGVDGIMVLPDGTIASTGRMTVQRHRDETHLGTVKLPALNLQFTPPVIDRDGRLVISSIAGLLRVDPVSGTIDTLEGAQSIAGAPWFRVAAGGPYVVAVRQTGPRARLAIWRGPGPPIHTEDLDPDLVVNRLDVSPDGRRIAITAASKSASVRPSAENSYPVRIIGPDGETIATLVDHRAAVSALRFDGPDRVVTGSMDGHIRTFDLGQGGRLVERHTGCPAVGFVAAADSLVSQCIDQIAVDRPEGRLVLADDQAGRWLMATDDGLFAASPDGDQLAVAVSGPRVLDLDRVALIRNRPDLIAHRFQLGDPPFRADLDRRAQRRRQRHRLTDDATGDSTDGPRLALGSTRVEGSTVRIVGTAMAPAGLTRWRLRIDGVTVDEGPLSGTDDRFEARAILTAGPNRIEVDVLDRRGRWSDRALAIVEHTDPTLPTLWVVALGVSDYADPAIQDLRFAHRDALDLAQALSEAPGFARVVTRTFVDEHVVGDAFETIETTLAEAAPRDTVILFVSGHGLYDAGGIYRYLTHDARLSDPAGTAPEFDRVEGLLDGTPARRRLMLLDTCQSGELLAPQQVDMPGLTARRTPPGARLIRPLAAASPAPPDRRDRLIDRDLRRRRGAVVLSSSRGTEASWERADWANGAFTEALLIALGGAADTDRDGRLTIEELLDHVGPTVSDLTQGRQHPTLDRANPVSRMTLPVTAP